MAETTSRNTRWACASTIAVPRALATRFPYGRSAGLWLVATSRCLAHLLRVGRALVVSALGVHRLFPHTFPHTQCAEHS